MVKDRNGKELNIGDNIWFTLYGKADIEGGVIINFTTKTIKISLNIGSNSWRRFTSISKISAKHRILKR